MLKPIILVGEQRRVLFLPQQNPIQIKGVAGSGKTTVALYRAKHLIETFSNLFQEPKVIIFTYNKSLVNYIKQLLPNIPGGHQQNTEELKKGFPNGLNVTVTNFHKWAYNFLENRGYGLYERNRIVDEKLTESYITNAIMSVRNKYPTSNVLNKRMEFFKEEFSWIKGKLVNSEEEYINAKRIGRGKTDRVSESDKRIIWIVFLGYQSLLQQADKLDFNDFALRVLGEIERDISFIPPYTHMVIDEAQDLNKAQILVLKTLVSKDIYSITLIADAAQRIYKSGFTWSEVGISVAGGRTIELKKNYRNTVEIAMAAMSLLDHDEDKEEFTEIQQPTRHGSKPILAGFDAWDKQINFIAEEIEKIGYKTKSTVLLHRKRSLLDPIKSWLNGKGINSEIIGGRGFTDYDAPTLKICTLSSIKGLEFENVFIMDLNESIIPYPEGFIDSDDEFHITTERRLLYTSMTRAKEKLYLTYVGNQSRFINELNKSLFSVRSSSPSNDLEVIITYLE